MNTVKICPKCGSEFIRLSYHKKSNLCHHCRKLPEIKTFDTVEITEGNLEINSATLQVGRSKKGDIGFVVEIHRPYVYVSSCEFIYSCRLNEVKKINIDDERLSKIFPTLFSLSLV